MFELVSYESLKDLLDLKKEKASAYVGLKIIKASVESAIEAEAGREFEKIERTHSVYIGSCGSNRVYLCGIPVAEVSLLTIDGDDVDDYTITAGGILFPVKYYNVEVEVTYTGGYTQTTLRKDVERAALLQTAYEYQNKSHIGASSVTTEGGSVQVPALQILPVVKNLISKFKHPWLGVMGL